MKWLSRVWDVRIQPEVVTWNFEYVGSWQVISWDSARLELCVSDGVEINAAIEAYSYAFGNRADALRALLEQKSSVAAVDALAERINQMQQAVFDLAWKRSEEIALTAPEIEQMAREYLSANHPEVNDLGLAALMRWVLWMSWHEGCLRS